MTTSPSIPTTLDHVRAVLTAAADDEPVEIDKYHVAAAIWLINEGCLTATGEVTDLGRQLLATTGTEL